MSHIATRVSNAIRHQANQAGRAISTKAQSLTRRVRNARDTVRRAYSQNANQWDQDKFLEPAADGLIMTNHSYVPEERFAKEVEVQEKAVTRWDHEAACEIESNKTRMLRKMDSTRAPSPKPPTVFPASNSDVGSDETTAMDAAIDETLGELATAGSISKAELLKLHSKLIPHKHVIGDMHWEVLDRLANGGQAYDYSIELSNLLYPDQL